jgi:hypothetical protein
MIPENSKSMVIIFLFMPLLFIMVASGRAKFDGSLIEKIHYNKIISPQFTNQNMA